MPGFAFTGKFQSCGRTDPEYVSELLQLQKAAKAYHEKMKQDKRKPSEVRDMFFDWCYAIQLELDRIAESR